MTSIEELEISGIRSFNPNPAHRQVIRFHRPLTVLLGKNGAGKTTVIEALLHACTGEMPPGASGAEKNSFIYDPRAAGEVEVKAQIRLRFRGCGGREMLVVRSLQATQGKTKASFHTLDSLLAYRTDATESFQSHTYRAGDLDRIVPELLGVSRPVLEHVLFCHQEDGNWPLHAPAEVKKRFDDIFASTRYVAALDQLKDVAKQYRAELRDIDTQLAMFREHKQQATQMEADAAAKEEQVRLLQLRSREFEPRLAQLRRAAETMDASDANVDAMQRECAVIHGRIDTKRQALATHGYTHHPSTTVDLAQEALRKCVGAIRETTERLHLAEGQLRAAEDACRALEASVAEKRIDVALRGKDHEDHMRRVAATLAVAQRVSPTFVLGSDDVDEGAVRRLESVLTNTAAEAARRLDTQRAAAAAAIDEARARRDDVQRLLDAEKRERDVWEARVQQLAAARTAVAGEANRAAADARRVADLTSQVEDMERRVKASENLRRGGTLADEAAELRRSLEIENHKAASLRMRLANYQRGVQDAVHVNVIKVSISERAQTISTQLRELHGRIAVRAGASEPETIKAAEDHISQLQTQRQRLSEQVNELSRSLGVLTERADKHNGELKFMRIQLQRHMAECTNVLGTREITEITYNSVLRDAEQKYDAAAKVLAQCEATAGTAESVLEHARSRHACMTCHRPLTDAALVQFVQQHEDKLRELPQRSSRARRDETQARETLARVRGAEAAVREVIRLTSAIPLAEGEIATLRREAEGKEVVLADLARQREESDGLFAALRRSVQCIVTLRREQSEAEETVRVLEGKLRDSGVGDIAQLQREYDEAMDTAQKINARLADVSLQLTEGDGALTKQLETMRVALHEATVASTISAERQRAFESLTSDLESARNRVQALDAHRPQLFSDVQTLTAALNRQQQEGEEKERALVDAVKKAEEESREVRDSIAKIRNYLSRGAGASLAVLRERLTSDEVGARRESETVANLRAQITAARAALASEQERQSQAERHARLVQIHHEQTVEQARLEELEAALRRLRSEKCEGLDQLLGAACLTWSTLQIREKLREQISELERQRAINQGTADATLKDASELRRRLQDDKYADIHRRHLSLVVKARTTEVAVRDVDKCHRAVEAALQSYHHEKLALVNQIIGDVWRQTYRGGDIDTIEIRSEDETSGTTAARRSYRYRVVLKRGAIELDMRGRCSAGQKVLASIVIRLALSEAFSGTCGILALDEPTTNLDEDNAHSLALALKDLIHARRGVRHFQLLIITHDEAFVRALGAQPTDPFYFIAKDRQGAFSLVEQRTFHELFA